MAADGPSQPRPSDYLAVGLVAGSVIAFQLALTRVFAILLWHHLTYMVISIAMLGFGAAGSYLALKPRDSAPPRRRLAWLSLSYALALPLAVAATTVIKIDCLELFSRPSSFVALFLLYAVVALPLFLAGLVIGWALSSFREQSERVYAADLVGSAFAGGAALLALHHLGSLPTVIGASLLGALGAFGFARGGGGPSQFASLATGLGLVLFLIGLLGGLPAASLPAIEWELPFAPGKEFRGSEDVAHRIPSVVAEVQVGPRRRQLPMIGGDFGLIDRQEVEARVVGQDGTAPTMLFPGADDLERFPFLDDSQTSSSYLALRAAGRKAPDVLVVGVGGGVDIMVALAEGAQSVTAVEANPAMIRMVTEDFDAELGGLFSSSGRHADRIRLITAEGRAFLRRDPRRYDLIQMSGVDSFTALTSGAYTLSEGYLYTVEAIEDVYARLKEGGIAAVSRFFLKHPQRPRETLRFAGLAREALDGLGIEDPESSIVVFHGVDWASTLIKRGSFGPEELKALRDFATAQGFGGVVFPVEDAGAISERGMPQPTRLIASYFRDWLRPRLEGVTPKPDIVALALELGETYRARFTADETMAATHLQAALSRFPESRREQLRAEFEAELALVIESGAARSQADAQVRRDFAAQLSSDSQRRQSFRDDYPYDVSPCYDDRPFFFDYYKWGALFDTSAKLSGSRLEDRYHPDFPVGHAILLGSILQIGLLAALLILIPLGRISAEEGARPRAARRDLVYFAALGLGFMAVEIILIQKLALFIGHPTTTMATVLVGLLLAAGIGSRCAAWIRPESRLAIAGLGLLVTAAIAGLGFATEELARLGLGWPLAARIAAAAVLVLPLGFLLGMPFPTGLRVLARRSPRLLPWAWGVNGFAGVLGSMLAIALAQEFGFRSVLLGAAGLYALGFIVFAPAEAGVQAEDA
jgi:hypothetical protein